MEDRTQNNLARGNMSPNLVDYATARGLFLGGCAPRARRTTQWRAEYPARGGGSPRDGSVRALLVVMSYPGHSIAGTERRLIDPRDSPCWRVLAGRGRAFSSRA
jgi:hypothetical protein